MKLDVTIFRYITKEEFRVLLAVEMGSRNHEFVPVPLIENIAKITRGGTFKIIQTLLRHKLLAHENKKYDGYRLTYHGLDFLALRALVMRGTITGIGRRLGVGKESDVHFCQGADGGVLAIKLHRLGRISFRRIKETRDYMQGRQGGGWQYMARLAAAKEFAYMKALHDEGFPVPTPVDQNRHCVVMSFVHATPLYQIRHMKHPQHVLERLMRLLVRLCKAGIIHGDFNEFNIMVDSDEKATLIDFPQVVSISHPNAEEQFDRDVKSTCDFFAKRFSFEVEQYPIFKDVMEEVAAGGADEAVQRLANVIVDGLGKREEAMLQAAHAALPRESGAPSADGEDDDDDEEEEENDDEAADGGDTADEAEEPNRPKDDTEFRAGSAPAPAAEELDRSGEQFQGLLSADGVVSLGSVEDELAERLAIDAVVPEGTDLPEPNAVDGEVEESSGDDQQSGDSDGPMQVTVKGAKKTRKRHSAKDARTNLQKQQKAKPAKPNNMKVKELRNARHQVKEHFW